MSIHIPLGVVHRLENPGKVLLNLIEVQSRACLGEDDIGRVDDAQGRDRAAGTRAAAVVNNAVSIRQDIHQLCQIP